MVYFIQGKSRDHRQKLYQCLLAAYLQPSARLVNLHVIMISAAHTVLLRKYYNSFDSYRSDIVEIEPALELLNTHGADFDMVEVNVVLNASLY